MARTVDDLALMLDAMAGQHPEDPLSLPMPGESFQTAAAARRLPKRVAFSRDLGIVPVAGEAAAICERAARRFQDFGVPVDEAAPDLKDAPAIFATLRAALFVALLGPLLETDRDKLKPEIVWNVEQGMKLTADAISRAERARTALFYRTVEFFRTYDLLVCPTVVVAPFDVDTRFIAEVEGRRFDSYFEWLALTFAITLTACPALSLPCGFTKDGLPVGLQLVGRPRGEAALLSAAAGLEDAFGIAGRLPIDPVGVP
jgi:amidase